MSFAQPLLSSCWCTASLWSPSPPPRSASKDAPERTNMGKKKKTLCGHKLGIVIEICCLDLSALPGRRSGGKNVLISVNKAAGAEPRDLSIMETIGQSGGFDSAQPAPISLQCRKIPCRKAPWSGWDAPASSEPWSAHTHQPSPAPDKPAFHTLTWKG